MEDNLSLHEPRPWPSGTAPSAEYCDEDQRLAVLASFEPDALHGDAELARIARFAAKLCKAPTAFISIVDAEAQKFLVSEGSQLTETPRTTSICAHTMLGAEPLEVLDASRDERFCDFSLVTGDAHLRYYVGAPLISPEGAAIGALCVIDTEPRIKPLGEFEREGLSVLAAAVIRRMQSHRDTYNADAKLRDRSERLQFVLDSVPDVAWSAAAGPEFDYFNARFTEITGKTARKSVDDWREVIHPDDFEASLVKFRHSLETASPFEDEWRLRNADGSYRWVLSRALPSSDDPATARWFGTLTDIDDAYRISEARELLAEELAHRIKNIFAVIIGLISIQTRGDKTLKAFGETLSETIRALARAQEFALKADRASGEDLSSLLDDLMAPYGIAGRSAVTIAGDEVPIGRRAATPLALVFHELATNSSKYGALSSPDGRVSIEISRSQDGVHIVWRESGGPSVEAPRDAGFGSRLMAMAIERQLGGTLSPTWHASGLEVDLTIPEERLAQ